MRSFTLTPFINQRLLFTLAMLGLFLGGFDHAWADSTLPSSAQSGVRLYNKGLVKQSLNVFRNAVKRYPTNAAAQTWLGKAYKKQGGASNQTLAMKAFETALELDPTESTALRELAELYSWHPEKRAMATQLLQQYVMLKPMDRSAKKDLAMFYIWQGHYEKARPYLDEVQGYFQNDKTFMTAYAQYLTYNGSPEEAVTLYETLLNATAHNAPIHVRQAYITALAKSGQAEQARLMYRSIRTSLQESGKMNADLLNGLSGMAFELGDYRDALNMDTELISSGKVNPEDLALRMARSYHKLGDVKKSMALFNELHKQGRLSASEKIEYADVLSTAMKKGMSGIQPSYIESIYKEALQSSTNKVGIALSLARLYAVQPEESANAVNYFIYAAERDATGKAKTELVDFLKSLGDNPTANAEEAYSKALNSFPNDSELMGVYAEFLSWNEETRPQALEQFLKLAQMQPHVAREYAPKVEQTLVWHQAKRAYMSWYEQLGQAYPGINGHKLAMARAYYQDKSSTPNLHKAYALYNELMPVYGEDAQFVSEFAGLLSQSEDKRMKERGVQLVESLYNKNPDDLALTLAYAKQLSYSGKGQKAIPLFDKVLNHAPESKEAWLGKANAYLWKGSNFQAIKVLNEARMKYPNEGMFITPLAEAYKAIGRYDKALKVLEEGKLLLPSSSSMNPPMSFGSKMTTPKTPVHQSPHKSTPSFKMNEMPTEEGFTLDPMEAYPLIVWEESTEHGEEHDGGTHTPHEEKPHHHVLHEAEVNPTTSVTTEDFDKTLEALKQAQHSSTQRLQQLQTKVNVLSDLSPEHAEVTGVHFEASSPSFSAGFMGERPKANAVLGHEEVELGVGQTLISDEDPAVGNNIGGRGDLFILNRMSGLTQDLEMAMRPTFRTGFYYTAQDGEDSTNRLRHWAVPNQLSFQLTPNVRVRAGYATRRFFIPKLDFFSLNPRATTAHQYSLGTTFGITDKLSFDGDASLENYTQSSSVNYTYQARLQYRATDTIKFQLGSRRSPNETSFLSYAGYEARNGSLINQLIGQVRETSIFGEVNLGPWKNVDINMGYEFAHVSGENVQNNTKNQVYGSIGYNWQYAQNHALRVAYETLFFGYAKNATLGYYNQFTNLPVIVSQQVPLQQAPDGYILGGYFSPDTFFLNDVRLDLRGSCINKFLEYKIGGSIGVQNFNPGIPGEKNVTGAAYSANAQLTANLTDAISLYGAVDYLDTGGVFSRWRLGGGLIYRPAIRGMMPVIGQKASSI